MLTHWFISIYAHHLHAKHLKRPEFLPYLTVQYLMIVRGIYLYLLKGLVLYLKQSKYQKQISFLQILQIVVQSTNIYA